VQAEPSLDPDPDPEPENPSSPSLAVVHDAAQQRAAQRAEQRAVEREEKALLEAAQQRAKRQAELQAQQAAADLVGQGKGYAYELAQHALRSSEHSGGFSAETRAAPKPQSKSKPKLTNSASDNSNGGGGGGGDGSSAVCVDESAGSDGRRDPSWYLGGGKSMDDVFAAAADAKDLQANRKKFASMDKQKALDPKGRLSRPISSADIDEIRERASEPDLDEGFIRRILESVHITIPLHSNAIVLATVVNSLASGLLPPHILKVDPRPARTPEQIQTQLNKVYAATEESMELQMLQKLITLDQLKLAVKAAGGQNARTLMFLSLAALVKEGAISPAEHQEKLNLLLIAAVRAENAAEARQELVDRAAADDGSSDGAAGAPAAAAAAPVRKESDKIASLMTTAQLRVAIAAAKNNPPPMTDDLEEQQLLIAPFSVPVKDTPAAGATLPMSRNERRAQERKQKKEAAKNKNKSKKKR
jgi:hypothetical protein